MSARCLLIVPRKGTVMIDGRSRLAAGAAVDALFDRLKAAQVIAPFAPTRG